MEHQAETSWHEILERGVTLRLENAATRELSYRGAAGVLTPALLSALRAHKEALCDALRPRADYFALSPAQKRMWLACRANPESPFYNMAFAVHFKGPFFADALAQTMAELPRHHPALRAAFPLLDGQPVQEIAPEDTEFPRLEVTDLSALAPAERTAEVQRLTQEAALRPFDIERAPLWATQLLKLENEYHVFLFNVLHLIGDRWSMRLLFQDISFRYAHHSHQKPLRAHSAAPPFSDFVLWQQRWLHGDECDAQMQYWREKLSGLGPLAALPLERLTDQSPARRGAQHTLQFPPEVAGTLKAHARALDATLFSVLLGILNVLIRQCSGLDDVRVGSMMARRNRVTTRRVVALLADNVLLRTDLRGARTLREAMARTRETVEGAGQNQNVFFDQVTALPEVAGLPAFEVYFAMMNVSNIVPFPSLDVETIETETETAKIDLTVGVRQENDGLQIDFIYDADMIAGDSVARIATQYGRLVEIFAADMDTALADLPFDESLKSATPVYVPPARETRSPATDDAPRDALERQLVEIWQQLLQVPRVGIRDDFFTLGGHSLLAVRLLDTVEKATGKTLSLAIFFQAPTIEGQAALLRDEDKLNSPSLITLQPNGTRPPLFCIDGAVRYRALAESLAPDQPVYGLIPANPTDGQWYSFDKIGERARHYLRIIKKVQPHGPYQLAGLSFAGLVALMIAKQLREDGDDVHLLALFDTYGPGYFAMPFSRRVGLHLHALRHLNASERAQYFRDRARVRLGKKIVHGNGASAEGGGKVATQTIERPEVPEDDWQVDVFARELSPEEIRHLRAMVQRTRRNPDTARYEGDTVLFVARDKPMEFLQADSTLGWGNYAPRLQLHTVAGDHTSLIQEPHVEGLSTLLRRHLYPAPASK